MFRRLLEYVFIKTHIIEGRTKKSTMEVITELLPIIIGATVIYAAWSRFGYKAPWYKRLWYRVKIKVRHARLAIVGW